MAGKTLWAERGRQGSMQPSFLSPCSVFVYVAFEFSGTTAVEGKSNAVTSHPSRSSFRSSSSTVFRFEVFFLAFTDDAGSFRYADSTLRSPLPPSQGREQSRWLVVPAVYTQGRVGFCAAVRFGFEERKRSQEYSLGYNGSVVASGRRESPSAYGSS